MNMKDIAGYEGLYAITPYGEVWSYKRKRFLKPSTNTGGYFQVLLYKDGKRYCRFVHRLTAEAYLDNPENLPQVNHKDEVKTHNWISNLEWANAKYNNNFGTRNDRIAKAMINNPKRSHRIRCVETGEEFPSISECARNLGISQGNLSDHLHGRHKHVNGLHFILCESS